MVCDQAETESNCNSLIPLNEEATESYDDWPQSAMLTQRAYRSASRKVVTSQIRDSTPARREAGCPRLYLASSQIRGRRELQDDIITA